MAQKIYYIYHWKRIFGALAVLAVLVFLVSYGVYSLLETENSVEQPGEPTLDLNNETAPKDHPQPQNDISPRALADQNTLLRSPDETDQNEAQQQSDKPLIEPAAISPRISEEERLPIIRDESGSFPVDVKTKSIESQPAMEASETETPQPLLFNRTQPSRQAHPDHARQQGQQNKSIRADLPQDPATGKAFQLQEVKKVSPSVKRFILARSILGREPIGSIDLITIDTKGVAVIYAFAEVINMSGSTLYYHWFYNMEQVAKVRVDVGSNRWRSNSNKTINNKMQGSWLVELRTEDGQILASGRFFARIP